MEQGGGGEISPSFDEQFGVKRKYEVFGGNVEATFLEPLSPKSTVPVIIAPGWGENASVFKKCAAELFAKGRYVIALDAPRHAEEDSALAQVSKVASITTILEEENIAQADIIAHSEGAITGAVAASLDSSKIRNIVLFNPAGLIGEDTTRGLVGRFALENIRSFFRGIKDKDLRELNKEQAEEAAKEAINYVTQAPKLAYQEIEAISRSQAQGTLKELHDKGIGIVVIAGVDDLGFPMERMQEIVKSDQNPDGFVDGFLSVRGGHAELYNHPDNYMTAAESMLTALEEKKKSNK
jgi:pimeloyl-ACP methyl ester carboxylesterase